MEKELFCEIFLLFKSFAALIALERPLPCVRLHVLLQIVSLSANLIALVTLEWFSPEWVPMMCLFKLQAAMLEYSHFVHL